VTARIVKNNGPHDLLCKQLDLAGIPRYELDEKRGFTREYRAIPGRKYRVDVAFPHLKVAVEVMGGTWNGGRHVRGAGYELDCEKACLLAVLGYRYLPVTTKQVRSGSALKWIEQVLRK